MPHRRQRHLRIFAAYVRVRRGSAKQARKCSTTRCSYMLSPTACRSCSHTRYFSSHVKDLALQIGIVLRRETNSIGW